MNNIDKPKEELINSISNLPFVKRLHELEKIIDNNPELKNKILEMKSIQKNLVNAKHYDLVNQAALDEKRLKAIKEDILNTPLLEEYLDLLDEAYEMLQNISRIIEGELNNSIK